MKQYKQKVTGTLATLRYEAEMFHGNYNYYSVEGTGIRIPQDFIENSSDWELVVEKKDCIFKKCTTSAEAYFFLTGEINQCYLAKDNLKLSDELGFTMRSKTGLDYMRENDNLKKENNELKKDVEIKRKELTLTRNDLIYYRNNSRELEMYTHRLEMEKGMNRSRLCSHKLKTKGFFFPHAICIKCGEKFDME